MTSGYEATKESINQSIQKFGFPYFDLILVHWLMDDNLGTYKALEEAYKQGKCKAIGLSNFNEREFLNIYNNFETKPTVNQIETHLHFQQKKMNNFLKNMIVYMNLGHLLAVRAQMFYKMKL